MYRPAAVLALLLPASAAAAPIRVAIEDSASSSSSSSELAAQLNDDTWYDFTATVVTADQVDSASELASYDVVILGDSGYTQIDWTTTMASALKSWVNGGGAVVSVGWVDWVTTSSSSYGPDIDDIQPIDAYTFHYGFCYNSATISVSSTTHPVTDGVGSSIAANANYIEGSPSACDATNCQVLGTSTGTCSDGGTNSIVVGEYGSGRIVYLGLLYMANASGYSNTGLRTGTPDRLLEQAVAWAADSVDADGDGVPDGSDNCPDDANASQADTDADGVGDACDICDGDDAYGDADEDLECADTDCDDTNADVNSLATEICDTIDNDCDSAIDDADTDVDLATGSTWYLDTDADGHGGASATRACDQPASHVSSSDDCNDSNAAINPDATEVCDAADTDEDCDGLSDDADGSVSAATRSTWYQDADTDGHGNPSVSTLSCDAPSGYISDGTDCDDSSAQARPGGTEVCDSLDNDCDGTVDGDDTTDVRTWYADQDLDGFGDPASSDIDCDPPAGFVADNTDCLDLDSTVYPGAEEIAYDGIDQDCSGADLCDADEDGFDDIACEGEDCDDEDGLIHPDAEEMFYDGIDQDCDEASDYDADMDGFDSASYGGEDCDDDDDTVYPDAPDEPYDGVINDCDETDEYDADQDGFDSAEHGGEDCDDASSAIHPDAEETWYDGIDSDCDEQSDYDQDGDGFDSNEHSGDDCDDDNDAVFPGAEDAPGDGIDQDCDGVDVQVDTGGLSGDDEDDGKTECGGCAGVPVAPLGLWVALSAVIFGRRGRRSGR